MHYSTMVTVYIISQVVTDIKYYCNFLIFLDTTSFRKSTQKAEKKYEFVPTNLHLQRMWVVNESLRKSGFYDTFTHGAFTSFGQKSPGLIKYVYIQ